MEHQAEGGMLAYLDGELSESERHELERHVDDCAACEQELQRVRDDASLFARAVAELTAPAATGAALAAVRAEHRRRQARVRVRRLLPYAATLVLGVAGVASATMPGSPVHGWPGALWGRAVALLEPDRPGPAPAPVAEPAPVAVAAAPVEAGVSITPVDGLVRIVLHSPAPQLQVRARLVPGERAEVLAVGAAASARFETGPGTVTVRDAGAGELRLDLPDGARRIRVEIDGALYLSRDGDQLQLHRPAAGGRAAELRFRVGADPGQNQPVEP